jgi:hypothetical protein
LNRAPAGVTNTAGVETIQLPVSVEVPSQTEPVPSSTSHLNVSVFPAGSSYEVFLDGQFLRRGPVANWGISPGEHEVTITSANGRQKRFSLVVVEGRDVHRIWDFERNRWRR